MIDIHSHILDCLDDGARSLEESIEILKQFSLRGITSVIVTPHYIENSTYSSNNVVKFKKFYELQDAVKKENIPISLYLGNEIFLTSHLLELLKREEIYALNGSRYLLIEFPIFQMMNDMMDILFSLRNQGYVPIIAHPERYLYFYDSFEIVEKLLLMGCLFQGNIENIYGKYGKKAKKQFLFYLKKGIYSFLATDIHHADSSLFSTFEKSKHKIQKYITKDKFYLLTYLNPLQVICNEEIK